MQTILGSGGAIGRELAKALTEYTSDIRLVSRNPKKINQSDHLLSADLTIKEDAFNAVEGSEITYLTIGLPYSHKVWAKTWPVIMGNVIEACKHHNTKLVFFDNIYMYDPSYLGTMSEDTPIAPVSKKGRVRMEILNMLMREVEEENLEALVARCADYYGAGITQTSMLTETVFNNVFEGKAPNWMGPLHYKHSFTFTPDAAKGTAMLGNTSDAYNQVWHLPTATSPLTGQEWIDTFAKKLSRKAKKPKILTPFLMNLLGLFIPVMSELKEMRYQYEQDYIFNSDKFEKRFGFKPTSYEAGIDTIIAADYS